MSGNELRSMGYRAAPPVIREVYPVEITSMVWINAAGIFSLNVTVEATLEPPLENSVLMSKLVKFKRRTGAGAYTPVPGTWVMTLKSGSPNVYTATVALPEGQIAQQDKIIATAVATWQVTIEESGDSTENTVPNH